MCKLNTMLLIGVWTLRTPVSIVRTTFAKHLAFLNVIIPIKMTPVHEVRSWSLGGQGVMPVDICSCLDPDTSRNIAL